MRIVQANPGNRAEITALLTSNNLPAADLPDLSSGFYAAMDEDKLVGLIGMERYGNYGLLRSMVVDPAYRNRNVAAELVNILETRAVESGISEMFLLTETAETYFSRKGYAVLHRSQVPEELKASSEFSHVCPASATVMRKSL